MTCDHEQLTTEELARDAYLAVQGMDDSLPDEQPGYREAVHLTSEVWARLRSLYCREEGCNNPHTASFPWCAEHLQGRFPA